MIRQIIPCIAIIIITFSCGPKENTPVKETSAASKPAVDGAKIYKQNCELCHGPDGKLGANGSKDLTVSELELNERIAMITKGKGLMMAFENLLSLSEIKAVAEYTMSLNK
jgi:mono/diheme cytochrome c family protein